MNPAEIRPSIAIVSREIAPLTGGGIAPVVRAAGELLASRGWDVTFITDGSRCDDWREREGRGDPETETGAQWVFVDAPVEDHGAFACWPHLWSARVDRALRRTFPERAPDVIEFSDYVAEGFVTVQRRVARDAWLDDTTVAVRVHTSSEMCSVLNGAISDTAADVAMFEMERYCLAHADVIIDQGGDIYGTYERFYAPLTLAQHRRVRYAFPGVTIALHSERYEQLRAEAATRRRGGTDPLYMLFLGRSERRKGIVELAEAVAARPDIDVRLDIVGGDTDSGPLATSVADHLRLLADADPRITYRGPVYPNDVPPLIGAADAIVVPSRWECWPNVAFESLLIGRPVLATPVGGLAEIVKDGVTGMLARGTSRLDLEGLLERAAARVDELRAMPSRPEFRDHLRSLVDPDEIVAGYEDLRASRRPTVPAPVPHSATVDVIIPYHRLPDTLEQTLRSLQDQTHRDQDVLIVNDGSLEAADAVAFDLADRYGARIITTPNSGLSGARNAGLRNSSSEYVCMLDADDELDPEFLERCLRAMRADRSLAYVTTWVRYIDDDSVPYPDPNDIGGYVPFGNWTAINTRFNWAGVCTSVLRRSTLDRHDIRYDTSLASYEDWDLYRQLAERGEFGAVLPDRLFHYRVRRASMTRADAVPNAVRLHDELRAAHRFRQLTWTTEIS